jgi:hypothetical protein
MYHKRETEAQNGPGTEASGCNVSAYSTHSNQQTATDNGKTTKSHVDRGSVENMDNPAIFVLRDVVNAFWGSQIPECEELDYEYLGRQESLLALGNYWHLSRELGA